MFSSEEMKKIAAAVKKWEWKNKQEFSSTFLTLDETNLPRVAKSIKIGMKRLRKWFYQDLKELHQRAKQERIDAEKKGPRKRHTRGIRRKLNEE